MKRAKEALLNLEIDQLLKKHLKWDSVKWNNANDCDVASDEDTNDSDDDNNQKEDTESVAKDNEIEDEMASTVIQEVCEDDPIEVEKDQQSIGHQGNIDLKTSENFRKF